MPPSRSRPEPKRTSGGCSGTTGVDVSVAMIAGVTVVRAVAVRVGVDADGAVLVGRTVSTVVAVGGTVVAVAACCAHPAGYHGAAGGFTSGMPGSMQE